MELKVHRNIALDQKLLNIKQNRISERRSSTGTNIQRPQLITSRRNTNIDQVENVSQPKSILWSNKYKNIPFSRIGRRRKSVKLSIDGEINSANTVEEEPIAVDERNLNIDVNDQHLIEFDNIENIHPKNGQKDVSTSCILKDIGFDGPVQNSYSCPVITPSVLSSQTNITFC